MTFQEALARGTRTLVRHRCSPHAAREAEELLTHASRKPREFLLAHPERKLSAAAGRKYDDMLRRRSRHEPVELITGQAAFFGRNFNVTKDTLIPRPATEILIEAVLDEVKSGKVEKLIDVGTGSGAIAITLALELPNAEIIATDTSAKALRVARANAKRHGVSSRVRFFKIDLLPSALFPSSPLLIIANLPYIPSADMKKLPPDVRLHEPRTALDGGKDGLDHYRRLLALSSTPQLRNFYFEILPEQYAPLARFAEKMFPGCRTKKVAGPSGAAIAIHIENRP